MTVTAPVAATASPPRSAGDGLSPAELWQRVRWPVLAGLLVVTVLVVAALADSRQGGQLDPAATTPGGSRALAVLLRERGVTVETVRTIAAIRAAPTAGTVVLVPFPDRLTAAQKQALLDLPTVDVVFVAPDAALLERLAPLVTGRRPVAVGPRAPACDLPAAVTAGVVDAGGTAFAGVQPGAASCYALGGQGTLVRGQRGQQTVTLLGTGAPLTNERLGEQGNAALALALLDGKRVLWLLPTPGAETLPGEQRAALTELLPAAVTWAAVQVLVAGVLLALWRARRLGPPVVEPLPVVVRAAETVEGRARLYRAGRARDRAAQALRAAAIDRLAQRVGLAADAAPPAVVAAIAERSRRPPAEVASVLYGAAPDDDRSLARLADDLDALVVAVLGSRPTDAGSPPR